MHTQGREAFGRLTTGRGGGEGAVVVEGTTRVPVICLQASRLKTNSYFYQGN